MDASKSSPNPVVEALENSSGVTALTKVNLAAKNQLDAAIAAAPLLPAGEREVYLDVTPAMAKLLICLTNTDQRNMRRARVAGYMAQINANKWTRSFDPVVIDTHIRFW